MSQQTEPGDFVPMQPGRPAAGQECRSGDDGDAAPDLQLSSGRAVVDRLNPGGVSSPERCSIDDVVGDEQSVGVIGPGHGGEAVGHRRGEHAAQAPAAFVEGQQRAALGDPR